MPGKKVITGMEIALGLLITAWFTGLPLMMWVHRQSGWFRINFRGDRVPCSLGLLPWLLGLLSWRFLHPFEGEWLAVLGFGGLGFLDDRFGQEAPKGLWGHLRALRQGKITTGLLKLGGGIILSIIIASHHPIFAHSSFSLVISSLLIALTANFFNLTDTRPGRAGSLFVFIAFFPLLFYLQSPDIPWTHPALWIYLGVWRILIADRRAQGMMGDTGSNLIGAMTGTLLICMPLAAQCILVSLLLAFHFWAERNSFSEFVERTGWLRSLDRLTGTR